MAQLTLASLKNELRIEADNVDLDPVLQALVDGVLAEAKSYLCTPAVPDEPDVYQGCVLLARAKFDAVTPQEAAAYRDGALALLTPYRVGMGL